jgi:hypothetical protein
LNLLSEQAYVLLHLHNEFLEVGTARLVAVTMRTGFGGERLVDLLAGDQLPRIC